MTNHQSKHPRDIRVMLQDIGDPLTRMPWPPTPEGLLSASIDPIKDTAIEVYAYGLHHAGGCTHDSKAYQKVGDNIAVMHEASGLQMREGTKRLIEQGRDPITIMCEGAHAAGKDFWLRMRMNDTHDRVGQYRKIESPTKKPKGGHLEPYYYTPQGKKDTPQWLIGDPDEPHPQYSFESQEANAPNYVHAPIREMMFALAQEAVCNYDIDGFEIDFIRFPYLFPVQTAWAHRKVMTAFVAKLRTMIDEQAKRGNRPIYFSARLPDTVELSARIGLDLPAWFSQGLLDMCVVSGGYSPFSTPWRDIVDLAGKHGTPTLACLSASTLNHWRWKPSLPVPDAEPTVQQRREHIRAAACRAYEHGISGFELWNMFYLFNHYYTPAQLEGGHNLGYGFTRDIADRSALAGMRKAYLLDWEIPLAGTYGHVSWCAQRPLMITPATDGIGQSVTFNIGDDLSAAEHAKIELWINIVDLFPEDVIEFEFNGHVLQPRDETYKGQTMFSNREFRFDLTADLVCRGDNELAIYLRQRTKDLEQFVTLDFARLTIDPSGDG